MTAPRLAITALATFCFAVPASAAGIELPSGTKLDKVDFERHVMGLFTKAGCNNGSCHGSFQGKNGFRLSLFALEPDKDHAALTRDLQGRRIDPVHPDNSLLLRKAAGLMSHEGGARIGKDSWQYQVFRQWIGQGAPRSRGTGEIADIEISPKEYVFVEPGQSARMKVTARFADGSAEDVTPFCDFRVQDDAVARVSPLGEISAGQPGDSGFVVLYRGKVAAARILVPTATPQAARGYPAEVNYVDREVFAKLKKLNVYPSELASDTEFLRRVTIDVAGALPTPEEVRSFLADKSPDKRTKKIEQLLKSPRHAALWATKFSDVTGNNTQALEQPADMQVKRSQMWHDWFRVRLEQNVPYDQIVKGVLTATSLDGKTPEAWIEHVKKVDADAARFDTTEYARRETLDLFWRRQAQVPTIEWGEKVAAAFLGVRLECAQCHKHPYDRWTQADYRSFANLFAAVTFAGGKNGQFSTPDVKKVADAENADRTKNAQGKNANQVPQVRELFVAAPAAGKRVPQLTHPDTNQPLNPKAPAGPEFKFEPGKDIRADLFAWMRSPDNPFFARSFVNRIWGHYFGVGLVDPVDDFSQANPPTNARLLDALAKEFVQHDYDIRHIERTILLSRTYQTSSVPNETNRFDKVNFARSYVRPMLAEVVVDVVNDALGTTEAYNFVPGKDEAARALDGKRMTEIGSSRMANPNLAYALRIFGRPPRTTACDCERAMEPALPQTLFRMTDQGLLGKMRSPTSRVATLLKEKDKSDDAVLEELFLATLSRSPRPDEQETFRKHRATTSDRTAAFTDVVWALLNTREFILNH